MVQTVIKWHGGKAYLASRIIALMPTHLHYVEPYAGGLSVLLAKEPEGVSEVVNDLDGGLINFWRVLQDDEEFSRFRRRCEATPFSQTEWESAGGLLECYLTNRIHAAWAFFVRCRQSLAGRMRSFAPLSRNRVRRGMNEQASAWLTAVEGLDEVHQRLRRVVVLNGDALEVIRQQDGPQTLFYLDPPYLDTTRAAPDVYAHEMTADDHGRLLSLITRLEGKVMVSGYPSALYDEYLAGWRAVDFDLPNNSAGGASKRRMTERLWLSPNCGPVA